MVKYGGAAMPACDGEQDPMLAEIAALHRAGTPVILIHGGGPEIDRALDALGITTARIDGQRVTDEATLEIVESVLCATLNKRLVRAFLAMGTPAVGVSGQDGGLLVADRAHGKGGADLGHVGEVAACNAALLHALLGGGFLPVVAPLAVSRDGANAYNVNADLAAAAIAAAVNASAFVLVTNVPRVLRDVNDPASGIDRFTVDEALAFAGSDACRSSMKPKLVAAATAVRDGASASYICSATPNAIASALSGNATVVA